MKRILLCVLLLSWPASARADLDPDRAERDVAALRNGGLDGFCAAPSKPLPPRAIALCPHAREIKDCSGFANACDALSKKPPDLTWLRWLDKLFRAIGPVVQVVLWILVAVVLGALLWPLVRMLIRAHRDRQAKDEAPAAKLAIVEVPAADEALAESDAETLLARAAAHEARGDLSRALSTYLAAALRALDLRGIIRLERHRTNGEYVRSCADADARAPLRDIVREVDVAEFGGRPPDRDGVARVSKRAIALVRGLPLAVLLLLSGCGSSLGGGPGHDPAGDDLLVALLKRQGMTVGRTGPLATLPLPKEGEAAPAVMVDVTRTPLDDDTLAHLVHWAKSGGVLVLVAAPQSWPKTLGAKDDPTLSEEVVVSPDDGREQTWTAHLLHRDAFTWEKGVTFAKTGDDRTFAAVRELGEGRVVGIAGSELFTNAALARKGNAAAALAILDIVDRDELRIARPEDGTTPPSNPLSALIRAGLGLGLGHAMVATLLLFLFAGTRLTRPTPRPSPRRRAFAEHVEATGALWARTRLSPHALRLLGRFVEARLRARGEPISEVTQQLLARAHEARTDETPRGDELRVMKQLGALVTSNSEGRR